MSETSETRKMRKMSETSETSEIRQLRGAQNNLDEITVMGQAQAMEYPFSFIQEYGPDSMAYFKPEVTNLPGQKQYNNSDLGNFPENIKEYLWVFEGCRDAESWRCLCVLTNGLYVYYYANCCYTGFDADGNMTVYVSEDPLILINYAMTNECYRLYETETFPYLDAKYARVKK